MEELKNITVSILGKNYSLTTDESEEEISQAAGLVDSLLKDAMSKIGIHNESKISILVALQLAMELKRSRKILDSWQEEAETLDTLLGN
jgi:cell division protein ZapA (FtsZ GTPase activity inhibitor)